MILTPIFSDGSSPLELSLSPDSFSETVIGAAGTTSGSLTLTVTGGTGFYTATWTSDNGNLGATNPSSTTTTTLDYVGLGSVLDSAFATIEIAVVDSSGNSGFFYFSAGVTRTS